MTRPEQIPTIDVLGTRVAALNMVSTVAQFARWISSSQTGHYVCVTGVHGVMEGLRRSEVRKAHNSADACVPDGMPMTWIGRFGGHRTMNRVYGPDLMLEIMGASVAGNFTHYLFGGQEGVAEDLRTSLCSKFPGLEIVGTHCPPFRPLNEREKKSLIAEVRELKPDVFWVGLSTPKQELFMAEYHRVLEAKILVGVGAAFDFHTGNVKQAPRWMMRSGLEWFFRLCMEPRRLGPRYLRNNPAFLFHIFLQETGLRKYNEVD